MRRYLKSNEAEAALRRGKSIECFIGPCESDGNSGVRWMLNAKSSNIVVLVFEAVDQGDEELADLYEFEPLNPDLDLDESDEGLCFPDFASCVETLEKRYPGCTARLVNQDEYLDFIARERK